MDDLTKKVIMDDEVAYTTNSSPSPLKVKIIFKTLLDTHNEIMADEIIRAFRIPKDYIFPGIRHHPYGFGNSRFQKDMDDLTKRAVEEFNRAQEDAIIYGTDHPNCRNTPKTTQPEETLPSRPRLLDKEGRFIKEV